MEYRARDQSWPDETVTHFMFAATMQLRTPYCVLEHHGETYWDRSTPPPIFIREEWQGIWIPQTEFSDRMVPFSKMASEIGPVPTHGSDFHRFLLSIRQLAESIDDPDERCKAILQECLREPWSEIVEKLGGAEKVSGRFSGDVAKI
ncbi:hypothetical protein D3C81_806130 [compost metagenome]